MNVNPFSYLIEKLKSKVSKSGDTMTGNLIISRNAATSELELGNNTTSKGLIILFSNNDKYEVLRSPDGMTANRNIYLPDASGTVALTSDIGNLKFYVTTLTDTIPANQSTASGVSISDLTSGTLTDSSKIKGISFFNGYPSFYTLMWYNNKVVLGDPSGATATARTVNLPIVIMYQ